MKDLYRLLRYAQPYFPALLISVVFMAVVGLSQGLLVKLIPLVFERALKPDAPDGPALLFNIPVWDVNVYLNQLVPSSIHNIWTMGGVWHPGLFLLRRASATIWATTW